MARNSSFSSGQLETIRVGVAFVAAAVAFFLDAQNVGGAAIRDQKIGAVRRSSESFRAPSRGRQAARNRRRPTVKTPHRSDRAVRLRRARQISAGRPGRQGFPRSVGAVFAKPNRVRQADPSCVAQFGHHASRVSPRCKKYNRRERYEQRQAQAVLQHDAQNAEPGTARAQTDRASRSAFLRRARASPGCRSCRPAPPQSKPARPGTRSFGPSG